MTKLLIGGSPCTYWSIAQKNGRETEASGIGWELFKNYLIAKKKFQPDFFLYENNVSASELIKAQIRQELDVWDGTFFMEDTGVRYIEINSALVSAQNRLRFYVHNCGEVWQPEGRGILLKDILETPSSIRIPEYGLPDKARPLNNHYSQNSGCGEGSLEDRMFSDNRKKQQIDLIAEPIRIGTFPTLDGELIDHQHSRIYSVNGKATTQNSQGGGLGAKTGLYAIPTKYKGKQMYEVKDGKVTIKGGQYPINLEDGFYYIRKLTVTECCRLQTMPDDYCRAVSNSRAYAGLGNGWTAEVIIHILNEALKNIPKDEEIVVISMYDGIGTGRYCLDKMGFTNVKYYAYEIDPYAMKVAQSNYPDIIECGDAFQVREEGWNVWL